MQFISPFISIRSYLFRFTSSHGLPQHSDHTGADIIPLRKMQLLAFPCNAHLVFSQLVCFCKPSDLLLCFCIQICSCPGCVFLQSQIQMIPTFVVCMNAVSFTTDRPNNTQRLLQDSPLRMASRNLAHGLDYLFKRLRCIF